MHMYLNLYSGFCHNNNRSWRSFSGSAFSLLSLHLNTTDFAQNWDRKADLLVLTCIWSYMTVDQASFFIFAHEWVACSIVCTRVPIFLFLPIVRFPLLLTPLERSSNVYNKICTSCLKHYERIDRTTNRVTDSGNRDVKGYLNKQHSATPTFLTL